MKGEIKQEKLQKRTQLEEEPENTNCIECGFKLQRQDMGLKYFCRNCYKQHANCHIRRREGIDCMNCKKSGVYGFIWNRCQHIACVQCYKDTPHQVKYEVIRAKNPNTRCPICAKNATRNCKYIKDGGLF